MQHNCFLSIIIPVYNVEHFVERCVRSCENQDISKKDYELICINDGSKDNSLYIINCLAAEYSNIKVISQPNGGLSAARNTGMRNAIGDYYMFVDSDDWIEENCLCKLTTILKTEKPDALAICAANVCESDINKRFSLQNKIQQKGKDYLKELKSPCAPFAIWSSSFLNKNNLSFCEGIFHEDSEFTPRAYYLAEKISFTDDIVYYVYQNPNSITRSINPKKSFDLIEYVCEHLSSFCKNVDDDYKYIFHNMISMYMNNALANILKSDKVNQKRLNRCIYEHRLLFYHLRKSTQRKYKIEFFLFKLFPNNCLDIYKIMKGF